MRDLERSEQGGAAPLHIPHCRGKLGSIVTQFDGFSELPLRACALAALCALISGLWMTAGSAVANAAAGNAATGNGATVKAAARAAGSSRSPSAPMASIQHWRTAQGARVYHVQSSALPLLDVSVEFPAGSARDREGEAGLAELTLRMLRAGRDAQDETRLEKGLADIGATLAASFDRDRAGYILRTLSSLPEREAAAGILARILQEPGFPQAAFDREKSNRLARVREEATRPERLAEQRLFALMYPGHGYGLSPTLPTVMATTRDEVMRFYREHFRAERAVVTIVGNLSREDAERLAGQLTARLPSDGGGASVPLPPLRTPAAGTLLAVAHSAQQSHILFGHAVLSRDDPDFYALTVGNYSLGGAGFSSRLYREIREKRGFAYSVYSYFLPLQAGGPLLVGLQTRRDQAGEALAVARRLVEAYVEKGPDARELKAAKDGLTGGFALRIDSNRKLLEQVAILGFYGLPLDWLERYVENVRKVTLEDVRRAWRKRIHPGAFATVVVAGDNAGGAPR